MKILGIDILNAKTVKNSLIAKVFFLFGICNLWDCIDKDLIICFHIMITLKLLMRILFWDEFSWYEWLTWTQNL